MYAGKFIAGDMGRPVPTFANGALDVNSLIANMVDRTPWQWYDTLKLAPGATVVNSYTLFAQPKGQPDQYNGNQTKTFVETNMTNGAMFTAPHDLLLQRIGFEFLGDTRLYDIQQIMKFGYFELNIDEKVFYRAPLQYHPAGVGISGTSTQTGESAWVNGTPMPQATRGFGNYSRYIPPLMNFGVTIYFPETVGAATNTAAGATTNLSAAQIAEGQTAAALPILMTQARGGSGIWLKVMLDGLTDRPVQ
jgi:hypothetical protein